MSSETLRLDKWLWCARFFKSRTLASKFCDAGQVRVNQVVVYKAHQKVGPGDVLTFSKGPRVRIIKIVALGARRGPAVEAQTLYEDLSEPTPGRGQGKSPGTDDKVAARDSGSGRPTKAQRRALDRMRARYDD